MSKKFKILAVVALLVLCVSIFGACELTYGTPDKLNMASSSVGERLWIGLQVAFLGMGTVFVVLVILIGFILLLKYGFVWKDMIAKKLSNKKAAVVEVKDEPVKVEISNSEEQEEIVAAISAALMAYYDAEQKIVYQSNLKFRVRSIKEIK